MAGARISYDRDTPEYNRVLAFTDGLFAIAMTLLVLDVRVPTDIPIDEVPAALWDLRWEVFSFFLSFTVIGFYWMAHHRLCSRLARIDRKFMRWNLVHLAFIAFLPFPTSLVGEHTPAPAAIAAYAINVALVSALDTWLFLLANRDGLHDPPLPREWIRFGLLARGAPVVIFLASVPVAWVDATLATWVWILAWPAEVIIERFRPPAIDGYE